MIRFELVKTGLSLSGRVGVPFEQVKTVLSQSGPVSSGQNWFETVCAGLVGFDPD